MTNNKKPSRQEMIDAIYEKIADKTLSFGCKIKFKETSQINQGTVGKITSAKPLDFIYLTIDGEEIRSIFPRDLFDTTEIIGHPVMIGDALNYVNNIEDNGEYERIALDILYNWEKETKPIEDQNDECIDFIYNLLP